MITHAWLCKEELTPWFLATTQNKGFCSSMSRVSYRPPKIALLLLQEGISADKSRVARFIKRYKDTGFIDKCSESSQTTKITDKVTLIVYRQTDGT